MAFFFKPARPKSAAEVVRSVKDSLLALDNNTVVDVKSLEKALEEAEKNVLAFRHMLSGDGEAEPNPDQVSQIAVEVCKDGVLDLFVHKLIILEWETRKNLMHCWCILLRQQVGSSYCCVEYIENHADLLDFLVVCYNNKEIALNCGNMLRECIKYPTLARCILESMSFELFFKYVELPHFDVASDAFSTFKDLLTRHELHVSEYLTSCYEQVNKFNVNCQPFNVMIVLGGMVLASSNLIMHLSYFLACSCDSSQLLLQFFKLYEKLLTSTNYVTRRQSLKLLSEFLLEPPNVPTMKRYILDVQHLKIMMTLLKDSSKNIQLNAFHIFKVFVANPNKPPEIISILAKNSEKLLMLLQNLPLSKGSEDEQLEEEKDLITKEIERISHLARVY